MTSLRGYSVRVHHYEREDGVETSEEPGGPPLNQTPGDVPHLCSEDTDAWGKRVGNRRGAAVLPTPMKLIGGPKDRL